MKIGAPTNTLTRKKRRPRGKRAHFHILTCPSCGAQICSAYRVRHTYISLRNWLVNAFALRRKFASSTPNQPTLFGGDKPWLVK